MILSVSRRTDIPNYYAQWFMNRLHEGYLYVRNPMNPHQVSRIVLSAKTIDCIVFWTKNPSKMMEYLDELDMYNYPYYFQFTLTGYGKDMENNIPDKKKVMIPVFQNLSDRIGKERVIWRYDPIVFTQKYTQEYHLSAFSKIAQSLCGYTEKCVISFVDIYRKNKKYLDEQNMINVQDDKLQEFATKIKKIADMYNIKVASCSEKLDLSSCGIEHNCCIDAQLIEKITGDHLIAGKDKNQRKECGCVESVEVGNYNTCKNGCRYCYACFDEKSVKRSMEQYDPFSPILCGNVSEEDKITERKIKKLRDSQMRLEDFMSN